TMGAQIYLDLRDNPKSPFRKVGRGKFTVRTLESSASSAEVTVDRQNDLVRRELQERLLAMEPPQFEILIAELLERLGYENVIVTGRSGDKGIDVTATLTLGGITSVKTVVQVKRYKTGNNISGAVIAQLRGSAEVDQRGLVITTSEFTRDGVAEANAANKMPVALVNGEKLLDLLFKHEIGVRKAQIPVFSLDAEYFENPTADDDESDASGKRRGLWPLPGGIDAYVTTLLQMLDALASHPMTRPEWIQWLMKSFPQVRSEKSAGGYANVPRAIGLTEMINGKISLTADGKKVHESKSSDDLYAVFAQNILGIEEIMEFFKTTDTTQTEANVMVFLKENLGVEWTTFAQVNFRLLWLVNLGKLKRVDGGYVLA
ncbi:MAG: restriction endonuclease, partial [Verrucomicrobia bacterium]|nr:restriction endonuclease [Verrucomicrobiota bacterium]